MKADSSMILDAEEKKTRAKRKTEHTESNRVEVSNFLRRFQMGYAQ